MRGRAPVGVHALSPTCLCAVYVCVGSLMCVRLPQRVFVQTWVCEHVAPVRVVRVMRVIRVVRLVVVV